MDTNFAKFLMSKGDVIEAYRINEDLKIVLDFVERYNKQDEEKDVAEAAQRLSILIS